MRVGIITFHRGANYGGTLQALALQEAVSSLGHDAEIIDYWPNRRMVPKLWRGWNPRGGLASLEKRAIQLIHGNACLGEFDKFRRGCLNMSESVYELERLRDLSLKYDAILTGSDQVWNFNRSSAYFLDLDDRFCGIRISYAACCTQEEQPENRAEIVGRLIKKFDFVSVRDEFSARAVFAASCCRPAVVCDPTLLMAPNWQVTERATEDPGDLVVYRLGHPIMNLREIVEHVKVNTHCRRSTGIVASTFNAHASRETDHALYRESPSQWINKIKHSRFFLTDSYHGVLFALRMGVPFLAFSGERERTPRMIDLERRFDLKGRFIKGYEYVQDVDWQRVVRPESISPWMQKHIEESWSFLKGALK